jgi:hypothetical protein
MSSVAEHTGQPAPDASWLDVVLTLLQRRRLFFPLPIAVAFVVGVLTLAAPKKYVTTLAFTPVAMGSGLSLPGSLAGLASGLGAGSLLGQDRSMSPEFYTSLVRTDNILTALALQPYDAVRTHWFSDPDTVRLTLIDLYEIDEGTPGKTMTEAIRLLRDEILFISYDATTAIVTARVRTDWRDVSYQMANRLLQLVDSFNVGSRQTQAGAESRFLETRVAAARADLRQSENELQDFLAKNRSYENDPTLLFQHNRLQREVTLKQSLYGMLSESYERARMEAVHNTPTISIVEPPVPALRFQRRHTLMKMLMGWVAGFALALVWIALTGATERARDDTPDKYLALTSLLSDAWTDAKHLAWGWAVRRGVGQRHAHKG